MLVYHMCAVKRHFVSAWGGWILGSCSQGRKTPLNVDVCVSECVCRYVVFVSGGREKNTHPASFPEPNPPHALKISKGFFMLPIVAVH